QPDDEYRIRTRAAPALAGGEELSRAHPDLLAGVALDELRAVTALGTLQPLAERKAQVIAVVERGAGSFLGAAHARQLLVGKTVGLEVGEAPVGIAEIPAAAGRAAIGLDGSLGLPDRLLRMPDGEVRLGIGRPADAQLAVDRDGALVLAEAHAGGGVQGLERSAVGLAGHEPVELDARLQVAMQLREDERVLLARD